MSNVQFASHHYRNASYILGGSKKAIRDFGTFAYLIILQMEQAGMWSNVCCSLGFSCAIDIRWILIQWNKQLYSYGGPYQSNFIHISPLKLRWRSLKLYRAECNSPLILCRQYHGCLTLWLNGPGHGKPCDWPSSSKYSFSGAKGICTQFSFQR